MKVKSISIRIEEEMLQKLHYVADYEGRSANSQILVLIRDCIKNFEATHGVIDKEIAADHRVNLQRRKPKGQ